MARKVTALGAGGQAVTFSLTRARRRSEQKLIPLTPAPRTGWQKFKRAAVG